MKPLLLLDVDGPINPFSARWHRERRAKDAWSFFDYEVDGRTFKVATSTQMGEWLLAMTDVVDLAWATTWNELANVEIGPRLGLPRLPVIELQYPEDDRSTGRLFWKTPQIHAWMREHHPGRRFAWLDDNVASADKRAFGDLALVRWIDSRAGIRPHDLDTVRRWAAGR